MNKIKALRHLRTFPNDLQAKQEYEKKHGPYYVVPNSKGRKVLLRQEIRNGVYTQI